MDKNSEKFFKVIYDRMRDAQAEIKATLTVTAGDALTAKTSSPDDTTTNEVIKKRNKICALIFMIFFFTTLFILKLLNLNLCLCISSMGTF